MIEFTFRPISTWPGALRKQEERRSIPFKVGYSETVALLKYEVEALDGKNGVIELALRDRDIRRDGLPRSDARRPDHPGVIVSFDSRFGPLRYFTDVFGEGHGYQMPGWQANLRAIALGLEALRKVDRYGITRRGEQYTGWKQLPSGIAGSAGEAALMTLEDAVELLLEWSRDADGKRQYDELDIITGAWTREAFRKAALRAHPDMGGDASVFPRLVAARDLVLSHVSDD